MWLFDRLHPTRALLAAAVCCLLAAGCSGSPTTPGTSSEPEKIPVKANFGKIDESMSEQDVLNILGEPSASVDVEPKSPKYGRLVGTTTPGLNLAYVDPKQVLDVLAQE